MSADGFSSFEMLSVADYVVVVIIPVLYTKQQYSAFRCISMISTWIFIKMAEELAI